MLGLYPLLAISLSVDTTEVLLAICWPSKTVKMAAGVPRRHECAIVMTVCDDARPEFIRLLLPLKKAGYDIYLLDDSSYPAIIPEFIAEQLFHVRRPSCSGAKAGNLNNWLAMYGNSYKCVAILDSDSIMPVSAVDMLLLAAEHPDNWDVAIFQSKIGPVPNPHSLFAQIQGVGARPRARIFERVHNRLGCILSFGHNQVVRINALIEVNGFDETLSSEDTVLSLELASKHWRTELVDTWTYECDPETVSAYIRRSLRWARQTVELFSRPWYNVPTHLKLLMCRHLLNYTLPLVGFILLCVSLWSSPSSIESVWTFLKASICLVQGYKVYGLALWSSFTIFGIFIILQTILAIREGISVRLLLLTWGLGSAPYLFMLFPLALALAKSAVGMRVRFIPTNSQNTQAQDAETTQWIFRILSACVILAFLWMGVIRRPASLIVGFNAIWLAYLFFSPVALIIFSIYEARASSKSILIKEAKL